MTKTIKTLPRTLPNDDAVVYTVGEYRVVGSKVCAQYAYAKHLMAVREDGVRFYTDYDPSDRVHPMLVAQD